MPDLMFLLSRDGTYLNYFASSTEELLVSPDSFIGKNMRDVLPPELAATFADAFQKATTDAPLLVEYSMEMPDGRRHYERRPIALDDDRVLSIVRDITSRRQSETALRESEHRYALATAAGGAGVWEFHVLEQRLYIDPALKRALGCRDQDIPETTAAWMALVHAEDIEQLTEVLLPTPRRLRTAGSRAPDPAPERLDPMVPDPRRNHRTRDGRRDPDHWSRHRHHRPQGSRERLEAAQDDSARCRD